MEISVSSNGRLRDEKIHREALRSSEVISTASAQAIELNRIFVRSAREMHNRSEMALGQQKLSSSRAALVGLLHRSGGGLTIMDIASGLDITPQGASKLVDALEKDLWVRRIANPADARSTLVELTETGRTEAEAVLSAVYAQVTDNWAGLTAQEQEILIHLLTKVRVHLRSQSTTWADVMSK